MNKYRRALTIAGSDSGGGAGIQADLKTFSALGCYGMSVITALTAQNTCEVRAISEVPADFVTAQIDAVLSDIGCDAVKIGMLNRPETIEAVAGGLKRYGAGPIVLDPVMVAKSGDKLLQDSAVEALKELLLPLADVLTPNIPEAEVLTGRAISTPDQMEAAGRELQAAGAGNVLMKGGHLDGFDSHDCLVCKGGAVRWFKNVRVESANTHGTGCTLSSAVAAFLASGAAVEASVEAAVNYIHRAIVAGSSYEIGGGCGPVHHFHELWRD